MVVSDKILQHTGDFAKHHRLEIIQFKAKPSALLANEGSLATISTSLCKSIWFSSFGSVFLSHKESIEAAK